MSDAGDDVLTSICLDLDLDLPDGTLTGRPEGGPTTLASLDCATAASKMPKQAGYFDLPSYHSPSTTETDSLESLAGSSGWDFASTESGSLGDVCEHFDLMLDSEEGDAGF